MMSKDNTPQTIVEVNKVSRGDLQTLVEVKGEIEANDSAEITSAYNYEVISIGVKEGDKVQKGQILATLDSKTIEDEITILNSGELSLTDCRGDVLVNGCLVGDDCTVQLDSYKGILIDGFECRWDSKFALSNIERSEYSNYGSEIIIVDTDISGNSFVNLNSSGKVILDNQEIRGIKVTDDGMIVNGVFKSKNQFVEEWNIE